MGNEGCSQYITHFFCHSFLLRWMALYHLHLLWCGVHPIGDSSSYKNFCNMSFYHRVQLFTNSSVSPFHKVQSFRNRLFQHGSITGSQVLPGICSTLGFPQGHRGLLAFTCSGVKSCKGLQVHLSSTMNHCRGTACLIMVFTMGLCGKSHIARGLCPEM